MPGLPSLDDLNHADPRDFADALAPLFEGAPRFLARLSRARPFGSVDELFHSARRVAETMPQDEQIELLDAHPRIGASASSMSELSRAEQGAAGMNVAARLAELNETYEARFGFRFVVFVAGRPRHEIVPIMERALAADRDAELQRGLGDVVAIAADRLAKLRAAEAPRPTIGA